MAAGYCYSLGIKSNDFFLKDNKKAFILWLNVPKVTAYDDLTMWRLYGNDANGVCLCYQVDKDKMDGFILAPICYANSNGNHPELDVIQKIMNTFVSNRRIILKRFSVWQHFFKPYEYSVEHEVRLLFQNECQNQENNGVTSKSVWIRHRFSLV